MAKKRRRQLTQGTDQAIEGLFGEAVAVLIQTVKKCLDQAIEDFKSQVSAQLGL